MDDSKVGEIRERAEAATERLHAAQISVYAEEPYEVAGAIITPLVADVLALLDERRRLQEQAVKNAKAAVDLIAKYKQVVAERDELKWMMEGLRK